MMHDELVKRLREVEEMLQVAQFNEAKSLIKEAADVIEELVKIHEEQKASGNMKEIKIKIDDYGYIYAEMPDGTIRELLADVFDNPYYGKIKLGKEVEVEDE